MVRAIRGLRPFILILVGTSAVTSGCEYGAGTSVTEVRDSAGIQVVVNDPRGLGEANYWRADSVALRIGHAEGGGPEAFHRVAGALYRSGEVLVADAGSGEIRWFDSTGQHLGTAGGVGEGPGEFRDLSWIGLGSQGRVLAWDRRLRRLSVFEGREFVSDVVPPFPEDRAFPVVHGILAVENLVATPGAVYVPEDEPGVQRPRMPVWIVALQPATIDTLGVYPGRAVNLRPARNQGWIRTEVPFGPRTIITTVGETVVVGDNSQYELRYLGRDGTLKRLVRVEYQPRPVTQEDLNSELDRRLEGVPPVEEIRAGIRASFQETPAAESMPAFESLLGDTEGNLWVGGHGEGAPWEVFDREGKLIAQAELPRGFTAMHITTDFILGVEKDELGVESVVLRRIIKNN